MDAPRIFSVTPQVRAGDPFAATRGVLAGCHIVFHHVALTGGGAFATTVLNSGIKREHVVGDILERDQATPLYQDLAERSADPARLLFLKGHWVRGAERHLQGRHAFFTILRDPVERFLAEFFWINRRAGIGYPWDQLPALDAWVGAFEDAGHANMYCYEYATDLLDRPDFSIHASPVNMASRRATDLYAEAERSLSERYFMVGVTEMYEESLFHLFNALAMPKAVLWRQQANSYAPNRGGNAKKFGRYDLPVALLKRIGRVLEADREIYDTCRAKFELHFRHFDYGSEFRDYKKLAFGFGS